MTLPKDTNIQSARSDFQNYSGSIQDRPRYRVEVSGTFHQALREEASRQGKHMKDLAEEIFQAYFDGKR